MNQAPNMPWTSQSGAAAMNLDAQPDDFTDFLDIDIGDNPDSFSNFNFLEDNGVTAQDFGSLTQTAFDNTTPNPHDGDFAVSQPIHLPATAASAHYNPADYTSQPDPQSSLPAPPYNHPVFQHPGHDASNPNLYSQPIGSVPPTPNSAPMYAQNGEWHHRAKPPHHQNQYRHFAPRPDDPNVFTPYLSPELDGSASARSYQPEYNQAAFGLSPLTSPAMNPQNINRLPKSQPLTANSSLTGSPVRERADEDNNDDDAAGERPRKTRKKASTSKSASSTPAVRGKKQPAGGSRRQNSLNLKIPQDTSGAGSANPPSGSKSATLPNTNQTTPLDSQPSSVSPRPLTEAFMPPPPKPLTPSTTPKAKPTATEHGTPGLPPATPASVMKIHSSQRRSGGKDGDTTPSSAQMSPASNALESHMESLVLPEAAAPIRDSTSSHNGQIIGQTPQPKSAPSGSSQSASGSPAASAVASPVAMTPMSKADSRGGRLAKKRNSSGSTLVSPALRPKLSPSVKPLLPEGANLNTQTSALLLASRSNYENILSRTTLPGVSYPSELATNLTSKRTSHKIAEQGRRNRINTALQEMQGLLPANFVSSPTAKDSGEEGGNNSSSGNAAGQKTSSQGAGAGNGNSKAATVECAIEYIKHLQENASEKDGMIERLTQELTAMKAGKGSSN